MPSTDDLTDGLSMKAPTRAAPRKTSRPPPKFDMAAELLMSGGREREFKPSSNGNNNYNNANDDATEAERLMQRLKAL